MYQTSFVSRQLNRFWTFNSASNYSASFANHNVFLTRDKTDLYGDRCTEGQKVYMNGVITYTDISLSDGRKRRAANITATNFFLCDPIEDDQDGTFGMTWAAWIDRSLRHPLRNLFGFHSNFSRCERREIVRTSIE